MAIFHQITFFQTYVQATKMTFRGRKLIQHALNDEKVSHRRWCDNEKIYCTYGAEGIDLAKGNTEFFPLKVHSGKEPKYGFQPVMVGLSKVEFYQDISP